VSGLNLGVGGGLRIPGATVQAQPATLAQTAYGSSGGAAPMSGGGNFFDLGSLATAVPAASLAWLVFLRYSLTDKRRFDLIFMEFVGLVGVVAGLRLVVHRHIAAGSGSSTWKVLKVFTG
jgi:hypothetical protein